MHPILLYNTLTKRKEPFTTHQPNTVRMYTCGPTVYHFAHLGNLRSYIMEDVLEKFLRMAGYQVLRVMNVTDVGHLTSDADIGEDKMTVGARREHKSVLELAEFYTRAFLDDCRSLNIRQPDHVVSAASRIPDYIAFISRLLDLDYAYQAGGNVYFDTSRCVNYHALAGHQREALAIGVRDDVTADASKRSPSDFVLWFTRSKFGEQELRWDSPWGTGYPGWHIECSAIAIKYLGEYLDLHCGGIDNIFPHHTNEIAQSEALLGHQWCPQWFHVQHLKDDTGKMSKSRGDFLTVALIAEKGYDPLAYRLFCLQSHYRKPLTFSYAGLDSAAAALARLKERIGDLADEGEIDAAATGDYHRRFVAALANDLNTATALTVLQDLLKSDLGGLTKRRLIADFDTVLSLGLLDGLLADSSRTGRQNLAVDESAVLASIDERRAARQNGDYARADQIRQGLLAQGIILTDTPQGTTWKMK